MPSSLEAPEPELQGLFPHFSPTLQPQLRIFESQLRKANTSFPPSCCSRPRLRERAAKTGSAPDGLQGEPGSRHQGAPQCPPRLLALP